MNNQQKITAWYFSNLFWNHWKKQRLINEEESLWQIAGVLANVLKGYWNEPEARQALFEQLKKYNK